MYRVILAVVFSLIFFCSSAFAASMTLGEKFLPVFSLMEKGEMLAMADTTTSSKDRSVALQEGDRGSAMESWHKYLGYGTVIMAGITAASNSDEDFHESAAYVTAAGALSTLLTGYMAHGDRFDTSQGIFSEENRHILMGTLGAVLLTTAVAIADDGEESSHSGLGVSGGILMTLGIIDIKW